MPVKASHSIIESLKLANCDKISVDILHTSALLVSYRSSRKGNNKLNINTQFKYHIIITKCVHIKLLINAGSTCGSYGSSARSLCYQIDSFNSCTSHRQAPRRIPAQ